ncbi:hypothetical protein QT381_03970 [Galbitalea sp. SE-J8]|uniref:hypothetical protein n=1 Tax=Galbitalea sp. SE-J8 TaxID=3054952 RepID=UPI00259D0682|nr:hypothetical protein [Galbitalea sp. SE-J8]MDM4762161.1 hypothetical protein [Galbitalea sp. SE-J8]
MATQFEFRLIDGEAPEGELEADQLIAIVQSLKEVATKLGRAETDAEPVGRPSKRTQRVAKLSIGLAPGSTKLLVRRADDEDALAFDLDEEKSFDEKFQAIVESIAVDERPEWVTDTLAVAAGELRSALEKAAPTVEFKVGGQARRTFKTSETRRETWKAVDVEPEADSVTFVGRLRAVNLDTHRLQVTDDVGNRVALPNVANDVQVGHLIGGYVEVVGAPERDPKGKLAQIHEAVIQAAAPIPGAFGVREVVSLEDILASAPGPVLGGIPGLTDDEAESYVKAIGL